MRTCCPEHLRDKIYKLRHPQYYEVPGHTFVMYQAKEMSQKSAKEEETRLKEEAEALKPKWTEYNKRLDGTDDASSYSGVQRAPYSRSYYLQRSMNGYRERQEWIHWALVLTMYPDRKKGIGGSIPERCSHSHQNSGQTRDVLQRWRTNHT
jgi:hypothetical protein